MQRLSIQNHSHNILQEEIRLLKNEKRNKCFLKAILCEEEQCGKSYIKSLPFICATAQIPFAKSAENSISCLKICGRTKRPETK